MRIHCTGLSFEEGKLKYEDARFNALKDKFNPKKLAPFYVEIMKDGPVQADVIAVTNEMVLDVLIPDIEKCETRKQNSRDDYEHEVLDKCIQCLESELPLSKGGFDEQASELLRSWTMFTMKPVLVLESEPPVSEFISMALEESDTMLFYTAGPNEVHSWYIRRNAPIIECAAKIHTDLARGFVKGDVVSFDDMMLSHNMKDAASKGLAKLVDRGHVVNPGDIIEIRSSL